MPLESVHLDPSPLHPMPPAAPRRWVKTGVGRSWPGARDPAIEWLVGSSPLARQVAASSPVGGSPPGRLSSLALTSTGHRTRPQTAPDRKCPVYAPEYQRTEMRFSGRGVREVASVGATDA